MRLDSLALCLFIARLSICHVAFIIQCLIPCRDSEWATRTSSSLDLRRVNPVDGLVADAYPPFSLVVRAGEDLEEASLSLVAHPLDGVVDLIGLLRAHSRDREDHIVLFSAIGNDPDQYPSLHLTEHQAVFLDMF